MPTPTGQISMSDVNVEIEKSATATVTFNESGVRILAGKSSGEIAMADMRGKSYIYRATFASGGQNWNLRTMADANGYTGQPQVEITIDGTVTASATSVPAIEIGSWPANTLVTVSINGTIIGKGGAGGGTNAAGGAGGPAIKATTAISGGSITIIVNTGASILAGGGGGGGGNNTHVHSGGLTNDRTTSTSYGGAGGRGAGTDGAATAGGLRAGSGGNYGAPGGSGGGGASGGAGGYAFLTYGYASINMNGGSYSGAVS